MLRTFLAARPPGSPPRAVASSREEDWDEAFLRVESYLHAHRFQSRVVVNRLTTAVIDQARRLAEGPWIGPPVTVAMGLVRQAMARWHREIWPEAELSEDVLLARGRLALIVAAAESRWPDTFVESARAPDDLAQMLRQAKLQPGPEVRLSPMPTAPLEFSMAPSGDDSSPRLGLRGMRRAAGLWLFIIGIVGAAWAASH